MTTKNIADDQTNIFDFIEIDAVPSNAKAHDKLPGFAADATPAEIAAGQQIATQNQAALAKEAAPKKVDATNLSAAEAHRKVAAGELSFKDVEGEMSISSGLAYRPAADRLIRNAPIHVNETTDNLVERAMLTVLGLSEKGKRIKGGRKQLDVSGLLDKGDRILDSASYREWAKQPLLGDIAAKVEAQIAEEKRETFELPCKGFQLADDGALTVSGLPSGAAQKHRMSSVFYQQFAERAPIAKPLAYNLNAWTGSVADDDTVRMRRLHHKNVEKPLAFAAVGPKYVEFDVDKAVKAISDKLPPAARGKFHYHGDGGRWRIDATMARPEEVDGDLHELGFWISSSDDGRKGLGFGFTATRHTCSNTLRIVHEATLKTLRHVGDVQRFIEKFEETLGLAGDAWNVFAAQWQLAGQSHPIDKDTGMPISVEEAIIRLCAANATAKNRLFAGNVSPELLAGRHLTSWQDEPVDSTRGLVNAVTRAAHEWEWSKWVDEDLEEQASQLLFNHVLDLPSYQLAEA